MIKITNRDNLCFEGMDPWETSVHPRKLALLKKSWAGVFREHALPKLPVKKLAKNFNKEMGRPTKELTTLCGACVLQQIFDLTDEETRDHLAFNQQWHYAFDTLAQEDQIISLKTLWNVRQLLLKDNLAKEIFNTVTDQLAEAYGVDTRLQRLDSVHIHSNMARLGRVRLLARVCLNFLKNLKRHHKELYQAVSDTIKWRYAKNEDPEYFGSTRPSESQKRLEDIAQDLYELIEQFKNEQDVMSMNTYKMLVRVFNEHCSVDKEQVMVKPAKEIKADSLQNPSDPDASYDGHKGQGYQVQIMETYSRDDSEQKSLQLLTYVNVEPAHYQDGEAVEPALEDVEKRKRLPEELDADTSYGSQDNVKKAKEHNVDLVAPVPGKKPENNLSDFSFEPDTYKVNHCPEGHAPQTVKRNKKDSITCIWNEDVCQQCKLRSECSVQKGKKGYLLRYTPKEVELALRRQYEQSDEFKEKYRFRSGIEATNSRYIHMTGARRLRYRGLQRVDYAARLKAVGINIFRTAQFMVVQQNQPCFA
jgi:hypothetical protein